MKRRRAFSLIEISVVILIIGILVSGILASRTIISKFRIKTAQTLTVSSPVNGIADSVVWLESSLEKSFKDSESEDTNNLTAWYDIRESANKNNALQSDTGHSPTYSNTINFIHAVKFDGTNGYFTVSDASFLNDSSYTIFVLEQRDSNKSSNYFIGDADSGSESTSNANLTLGYSANGAIKHSQGGSNSYTGSVSTYEAAGKNPKIFSFVHDKTVGKKTYVNGILAATSTNTDSLSGVTSLKIGSEYEGQIGELIIFARALTTEERQSVEDYLGKKWNSTILRDTGTAESSGGSAGSCLSGTVSNTGCRASCAVTAAAGITDTTVVDGSGSLTCDTVSHYTGSLPYTCDNGAFSYTGATSCSCGDGYALSGGSCVAVPPVCSGGTETTVSGYKIHTFTSSGTLTCTSGGVLEVLVVAGGGGGAGTAGADGGGGGGGGGLIYNTSYTVTSGGHSVTVGSGGTGSAVGSGSNGANGGSSAFNGDLTAVGGGGGAYAGNAGSNGGSGGSSGVGSTALAGGTATSGQGNNGASNSGNGWAKCGGGAGGAGGAGSGPSTSSQAGGNGGNGLQLSITGSSVYYSGGGAGSCSNGLNNNPGPGAGGNGSGSSSYGGGGAAVRYYGGGYAGGNGGPGIVVVRYSAN